MTTLSGAVLRLSTLAAALVSASAALGATLTPIAPYDGPGALSTSLLGINNAGWTTGGIDFGTYQAAFLRSPTGEYTVFSNPSMPGANTIGRGISNTNTIVGFSNPGGPATNWRSFQRTADGIVTNLVRPSDGLELAGIAQGINDAGAIAGNFRSRPGGPGTPVVNSGFILNGSSFTELTFAGRQVNARGINNAGTAVGFTFDPVSSATEAFIWSGGSYQFFSHPLATGNSTIFTSINNVGQIAGGYNVADGSQFGQSRAFIYDMATSTFTEVEVPGAYQTQTFGINDLGQYVVSSGVGQFIYSPDGPTAPDGSPVFMPVAGGNLPPGQAQFEFTVAPGTTYYIDPPFAKGFEYLAGDGPLFASVIAPADVVPSNIYELWLWNGSSYAFANSITGGLEFTFAQAVDRFQLRGIPRAAGIDPISHEGFVTGLTFASAGRFNGFQNAIVGVPEPASWAMLIAGFGLVGAVQRRRRRVIAA